MACGSDAAGPSGISADQVSGIWDIHVTGCVNGDLLVRLSASNDGALTGSVNAWTDDESLGFNRPLDGAVNLPTGSAELHLWGEASHTSTVAFLGTLRADGFLEGTLSDPLPGYGSIFNFSGDPCVATATGHRRS